MSVNLRSLKLAEAIRAREIWKDLLLATIPHGNGRLITSKREIAKFWTGKESNLQSTNWISLPSLPAHAHDTGSQHQRTHREAGPQPSLVCRNADPLCLSDVKSALLLLIWFLSFSGGSDHQSTDTDTFQTQFCLENWAWHRDYESDLFPLTSASPNPPSRY